MNPPLIVVIPKCAGGYKTGVQRWGALAGAALAKLLTAECAEARTRRGQDKRRVCYVFMGAGLLDRIFKFLHLLASNREPNSLLQASKVGSK
jgi:hypothetical protein